ncbi:MAG: flagellar hook-associated protein 2 [Eubacteriales bacterium]|nr:flagellar hook-associated protein 2 [Eubacteriales bacterium]
MRIGGLASGLDTASLIKQLMDVERIPLLKMQERQQILKWRKEALEEFRSKLSALQSKVSTLLLTATFTGKTVSSSNESVATATATTAAATGTYTLTVNSLATATTNTSTAAIGLPPATAAVLQSAAELNTAGGDADPNAPFNSGQVNWDYTGTITDGSFKINGVTINVSSSDTINTVLTKINESAAGVVATFTGDKVVLTQKTKGAAPTITVSDDTSGFVKAVKLDTAVVQPGTDSGFTAKMNTTGLGFTDGYFTINNITFAVNTATESVQDILNKINNSAAGVTAFYDEQADKITLTSKETGNKPIVIDAGTTNFLSIIKIDPAAEVRGQDGSFTINGATITRSSNTFEYNGVTFTARSTGTVQITVKQDVDKTIAAVEAFVNEYNSVIEWINTKLKEKTVKEPSTEAEKKQGILNSDYLLKMVYNELRRSVSDAVSGLRVDMQMLAQIGISTGASTGTVTGLEGKLVLDKEKLRAALEKDPLAVYNLFAKGTASVTETFVGDGSTTTFNLSNKGNIVSSPLPVVKIVSGGVTKTLTYVSGTPGAGQFTVDFANGRIILGQAPAAGEEVQVSYEYFVSSGSAAGVAVRLKYTLDRFVRSGGFIDNRIGSNGSLTKEIENLSRQMERFEERLAAREEELWRQFTALEKLLSTMMNQSQWLAGQLNQLMGNNK